MIFKNLDMNPVQNPAVLDTCSWDTVAVAQIASQLPKEYIEELTTSAIARKTLPQHSSFSPHDGSLSYKDGKAVFLASLSDGQQVFVELLERDQNPNLLIPPCVMLLVEGPKNERQLQQV